MSKKTTECSYPKGGKGKKADPITSVLLDTSNILMNDLSLLPFVNDKDVSVKYLSQQLVDEDHLKETVIAHS